MTWGAEGELNDEIVAQLEEMGMDAAEVERSVRGNLYNHESACYDMLLTSAQIEASARHSSRREKYSVHMGDLPA